MVLRGDERSPRQEVPTSSITAMSVGMPWRALWRRSSLPASSLSERAGPALRGAVALGASGCGRGAWGNVNGGH
jgi:hypothetical protein